MKVYQRHANGFPLPVVAMIGIQFQSWRPLSLRTNTMTRPAMYYAIWPIIRVTDLKNSLTFRHTRTCQPPPLAKHVQ